jgi:hypothetical protein
LSEFAYTPLSELAHQGTEIPGGFTLQISNFSFVTFAEQKNRPKQTKLRFSLIVEIQHPTHGNLGFGWDGCLAHKMPDGLVCWGPPMSRISPYRSIKTGWVNQQVYDLVVAAICSTEYVHELGAAFTADDKNPLSRNPDLPTLINVG